MYSAFSKGSPPPNTIPPPVDLKYISSTIRKEFAKLNGIDYNFKECTYTGPCAGTCIACDNEANELRELAKNLDNVKYPKVVMNNNDEK